MQSGVNPKTETLVKAHLAERTASGKETSGAVSERVPADGGRAIEELRQHVALAQELGVHRRLLYKWRDQLEPMEESEGSLLHNSRVATLRKEVSQLKRVLADKVVEMDFFRGALHKVEARRQGRGSSGEKASTTRSGR
jgi:transposase-like protein